MSVNRSTQVLAEALRYSASEAIYDVKTQATLKKAAERVERGEMSTEDAVTVQMSATVDFYGAVSTGNAFNQSVPAGLREARKEWLFAKVDNVIARLNTLDTDNKTVPALEGAKAGDLNTLGQLWFYADRQMASYEAARAI
jgi:hypothetical protein